MNHMSAGLGPHMPPAHPHSRRQQEYHHYHHPVQPQSPIHPAYPPYPQPGPYYPHPAAPPQHYPPPRWQPAYAPMQAYYQPPPPPLPQQPLPHQQVPQYQPRSPMVVTSQPFQPSATPVTRHTPAPPHAPPPTKTAPSPHLTAEVTPQRIASPVAPPSPMHTPNYEQEQPVHEREATPSEPVTRRQSTSVSIAPFERMPFYPPLPWYSTPDATFPPRSARRRRRRQVTEDAVTIFPAPAEPLGQQDAVEHEGREPTPDEAASEVSTIAAPSELETPATSQAPSERDYPQHSTPIVTTQPELSLPKPAPQPSQHLRRDTRTAIAIPNLPGFNKPKLSSPAVAEASERKSTPSEMSTPVIEEQKPSASGGDGSAEEATPAPSPPSKPAPKSWADLVKRNAVLPSSSSVPNGGVITSGVTLPSNASAADALKQYSVQIDAKLSFLEPRGLVNTGNMCYMNSILQVLVFCVPFYNFLDQMRLRTVHSMKSDTPLLDAMIMFMKEFRVMASAESSDMLRMLLSQQQLEQYGEPVTPEYVYDAIRKLDRFVSMRRGHQQDAEEFLGFLLEGLHDECVAIMRGQTVDKAEENGVTSPTSEVSLTSGDGWFEVGPKQRAAVTRTTGQQDAPSPITKIFGGHLRSELRVPGSQPSVTLEQYKPLQLDIGASNVNNIVDALRGLTRTEALTGDFGGRSNSAKKQVFIDSLPPVLILHLKRFQYDNNLTGTQKIWKKVGYPLELEIPREVFQPTKRGGLAVKGGPPKYRLTSVVYHHGKSAAGGHYTVDVLRPDGREWIRMDDTVIRRIRPEDVAEGGAEEDPKLLARALEQHKADQELQKQRNIYQGLDEAEHDAEDRENDNAPWSEVNGHVPGHSRKWASVATTTGSVTPSNTGKKTPTPATARKEGVRDNKVAYILLYERMRG